MKGIFQENINEIQGASSSNETLSGNMSRATASNGWAKGRGDRAQSAALKKVVGFQARVFYCCKENKENY